MRADQARSIDISNYLQYVEGITPVKTRMNGRELWYRSPIRSGDNTPSFKVDTTLNLWYDHGSLTGGNTLDLVIALRQCTVSDALAILERSGLYQGGISRHVKPYKPKKSRQIALKKPAVEKEKTSAMQLLSVSEIKTPLLIQYITKRGIDLDIARQYLKELVFKPQDKLVQYYGIGFASGDGYEVRNKYFKGFIGTYKGISIINPKHGNDVVIFEGFMDFLSYLTYLKQHKNSTALNVSVAVMNSITMKNQLIEQIAQYNFNTVYCFLDNDEAGQITLEALQESLNNHKVIDKSALYHPHKDFNAWLINKNL